MVALAIGAVVLRSASWSIALFAAVGLVVNVVYALQLLRLVAASDRALAADGGEPATGSGPEQ